MKKKNKTAIVSSLFWEIKGLWSRLLENNVKFGLYEEGLLKSIMCSPFDQSIYLDGFTDPSIILFYTGFGKKRAISNIKRFLDTNKDIDTLNFLGFSGALSQDLRIGEIISPNVLYNDMTCERLVLSNGPEIAMVSASFICDTNEKLKIKQKYPYAKCIDLESFFVVKECLARNIDVKVYKAITDTLDCKLPETKNIPLFFNTKERRPNTLSRLSPQEIKKGKRLYKNSLYARKQLTKFILKLIKKQEIKKTKEERKEEKEERKKKIEKIKKRIEERKKRK